MGRAWCRLRCHAGASGKREFWWSLRGCDAPSGTPALTTRGLREAEFEAVAAFLDRAASLALAVQARSGPKLVDFVKEMEGDAEVGKLRDEVVAFARGFPMPM